VQKKIYKIKTEVMLTRVMK